jgi:cytoskeletal protein CcmA (bactofilin family)
MTALGYNSPLERPLRHVCFAFRCGHSGRDVRISPNSFSGTFDGKLQAKKVALTKAARMKGEIHYETLEMEAGASFEGRLNRVEVT